MQTKKFIVKEEYFLESSWGYDDNEVLVESTDYEFDTREEAEEFESELGDRIFGDEDFVMKNDQKCVVQTSIVGPWPWEV